MNALVRVGTRSRWRNVFVALAVGMAVLLPASTVYSDPVALPTDVDGGGPGSTPPGSNWVFRNDKVGCDDLTALTVSDATLDPDDETAIGSQGDAYDGGLILQVDGVDFVDSDGTVDVTGTTVTADPATMSGLEVGVQYHVLTGSEAIIRTLASFHNSGSTAVSATASFVTNVGSNGSTGIRGTSSSDATFTTGDRWVVTSDSATTPSDPVNTHVLFGPGSPDEVPTAVSETVFDCAGMEGISGDFEITVPPGQTGNLLFFNQLNQTNEDGLAAAALNFDSTPGSGSFLVEGLSAAQLDNVLNWDFEAAPGSGPDPSSQAPNRLDAFVRGTDDQLYQKTWNGSTWSAFIPLGGVLTSDPTAVSWADGRIDVFVRGTDNQLWHKWFADGGWSAWEPLGGVLTSAPDVASWAPNRLDVFVRGADNQLWHKWWNGSVWSGYEPLGGELNGGPGSVSWDTNRIDVFVRGTDNQLWHKWWNGSVWSGYEPLGGVLASDPDPASWAPNRIDVFVRGTDNQLWHRWWDGASWQGYEPLEGVLTSSPGAVSWSLGRIDVFVRGTDGALWHKWFSAGAWSAWESLGGQLQ
jgi:hypothetical protein